MPRQPCKKAQNAHLHLALLGRVPCLKVGTAGFQAANGVGGDNPVALFLRKRQLNALKQAKERVGAGAY